VAAESQSRVAVEEAVEKGIAEAAKSDEVARPEWVITSGPQVARRQWATRSQ